MQPSNVSWLDFAVVLALVVGAVYLFTPIAVYFISTSDFNFDVSRCAENALPGGADRKMFDEVAGPLLKEGFEDRGFWMLTVANKMNSIGLVMQWLYHPGTATSVTISRIKVRGRRPMLSVCFGSDDHEGRCVTTTRGGFPNVISDHPRARRWHLPWVKEPAMLFRAHQILCKASGFGPWQGVADPARFPAIIRESTAELVKQQVELGLFRMKGGTTYGVTEKGAFLVAWRSLPPVKQWRSWRETQQVMRILAESGEWPGDGERG